jgi:hypothetical protein
MTKDKALDLALEALTWANKEINGWRDDAYGYEPEDHPEIMSAIAVIKEALAQPAQKPAAWGVFDNGDLYEMFFSKEQAEHISRVRLKVSEVRPLYTPPTAQRPWVGLTDEELDYLCHLAYTGDEEFALTVQAKLKEKNT